MSTHNNIAVNSRDNAFDLLKLLGAYIVLLSHSFRHFSVNNPTWSLFFTDGATGVMIFFAITGFVIMPAYERSLNSNHSLKYFYWNRIIRIFPPIIFSFIVITIIDALIIHENIFSISYLIYGIKYCVFASGGGYGSKGISNGVLWTIIPDIVYYIFTPLIYKVMKNQKTGVWLVVIAFFWQFNVWDKQLIQLLNHIPVIGARFGSTFSLCFMYEFLIGSFLYFKRESIMKSIKNHPVILYAIFIFFCLFFEVYRYTDLIPKTGEMHTPWFGILVCPLTILFGLYIRPIHLKLDLSFGIFLFHMIVVGTLLFYSIDGVVGIIITALITPCLAFISRTVIEKPILNFKK